LRQLASPLGVELLMLVEKLPVGSSVTRSMQSGGSWAIILLAACAAACGSDDGTLEAGSDDSGSSAAASSSDGTSQNSEASRRSRSRDTDSSGTGSTRDDAAEDTDSGATGADDSSDDGAGTEQGVIVPPTNFAEGPAAGNPDGECTVPSEALPVDTSQADNVVGDGTPASCTADAFIAAVARGGVIRFDCGPDPVTITLDRPAKVRNDASDDVVIDGGGKVTLSGGGTSRILYMNTCDEDQAWTTSHCDNQETPRLTLQNLTFVDASSKSEDEFDGGGAIWVRGGRFKVINSRFFNNACADTGPDVGGGALRVFSQFDGQPVYVVNSTFGGAEGLGNVCSNGGALSSIHVSWNVINSVLSYNHAVGNGGNPAEAGTPGGGSGGAIYNDGNTMTLSVCGTRIEHNEVNAFGSAIFFVSNDHSGSIVVEDSIIRDNAGGGWNVLPGISMHEDTARETINSIIE
jgi:hypothetical protein